MRILTWTMPLRTTETMSVVLFCPYFLHSLKKTYYSNDSVVLRWFQRSNLCILSQTCMVNYSQRDYHKEFCRRCASVHNQDIQKQLFLFGNMNYTKWGKNAQTQHMTDKHIQRVAKVTRKC